MRSSARDQAGDLATTAWAAEGFLGTTSVTSAESESVLGKEAATETYTYSCVKEGSDLSLSLSCE